METKAGLLEAAEAKGDGSKDHLITYFQEVEANWASDMDRLHQHLSSHEDLPISPLFTGSSILYTPRPPPVNYDGPRWYKKLASRDIDQSFIDFALNTLLSRDLPSKVLTEVINPEIVEAPPDDRPELNFSGPGGWPAELHFLEPEALYQTNLVEHALSDARQVGQLCSLNNQRL